MPDPLHCDQVDIALAQEVSALTGRVLSGLVEMHAVPSSVISIFEEGGKRLPEGVSLDRDRVRVAANSLVMNICCTTRSALREESDGEDSDEQDSDEQGDDGSSSSSGGTAVYGDPELRDLGQLLDAAIQADELEGPCGRGSEDAPRFEDLLRVRRLVREGCLPPRDGAVYEDTGECVMCYNTVPLGLLWGYAACGHMCFCEECAQDMLEREGATRACCTCSAEPKQSEGWLTPMWSKRGRALDKVFV